jgi:hypothetical protein
MWEQAFSCLTSIQSKDRYRPISVCAHLKFNPELCICEAKNKHRFHIKDVNYILYFAFKNNAALDDVSVHIALHYLIVFGDLAIQHCQYRTN